MTIQSMLQEVAKNERGLQRCYGAEPQYHCPIYDELEKPEVRTTKLAQQLLANKGIVHFELEELQEDDYLSVKELCEKFPLEKMTLSLDPDHEPWSSGDLMEVTLVSAGTSISSMQFYTNRSKKTHYKIELSCNNWQQATELHLLMCNVFGLPYPRNYQLGDKAQFHAGGDHQLFLDMANFLLKDQALDEGVEQPLKSLFHKVMLFSKDSRYQKVLDKLRP